MAASIYDSRSLLRTLKQTRQTLAATCRSYLLEIEKTALTDTCRKEMAAHEAALREAMTALLLPIPTTKPRQMPWHTVDPKTVNLRSLDEELEFEK